MTHVALALPSVNLHGWRFPLATDTIRNGGSAIRRKEKWVLALSGHDCTEHERRGSEDDSKRQARFGNPFGVGR